MVSIYLFFADYAKIAALKKSRACCLAQWTVNFLSGPVGANAALFAVLECIIELER